MFKVIATILALTAGNPNGEQVGQMTARHTFDTVENCQAWLDGQEGAGARAALDAKAQEATVETGGAVHYKVTYECKKTEEDDGSL